MTSATSEAPTGTILVVDDDDSVRTMVARVLESHGHRVVQAPDADAALKALDDDTIHLVISDVVMPGRSGIELRREVALKKPGLPVILVSGYSPEVPAEFAHRAADTRFVPKPFAVEHLIGLVNETLARQVKG